MAWFMANERRERCRALGRVDQSSGEDDERKMNYEIIGAAGELAVAKALNICPDFGEEAGLPDFKLPFFKFKLINPIKFCLHLKSIIHCKRGEVT